MRPCSRRLAVIVLAMVALIGAGTGLAATGRVYTYDASGNVIRVANVDTNTDVSHCGSVGRVCSTIANSFATCTAGACGVACSAGYYSCNSACVTRPAAIAAGCSTAAGDAAWLVPIINMVLE